MQKCISCGKCTPQCPSARHGGIDPHEVMMIGEGDFSQCIECGTCSRVCRRTDPFTVIKALASIERCSEYTDIYRKTGFCMPMEEHPSRTELEPEWDGGDVSILPGCVVKCRVPFLEAASCTAVKAVGKTVSELEGAGCCLRPSMFSDIPDLQRHDMLSSMASKAGGGELVTLCAGCTEELAKSSVDSKNIITFLHDNIENLPRFERPFKVAVEPGCNAMAYRKELEEVVEAMGLEAIGNSVGCCGRDTDVSVPLMEERMRECSGSSLIVVGCPRCFAKYDAQEGGRPVAFISELVAMAAGDLRTLRYHDIPVDLGDEEFYNPKDKVVRIIEDKTRW